MDFKGNFTSAAAELSQVAEKIDAAAFEKIADMLIEAKRVFAIGGGREGLVTRAFTMRLMHLGKPSFWVWADDTPAIGEGDVLVCPTGSCTGGVLAHVVKTAKEHGAKIIVVTADNSGPVGRYADFTAFIPATAYLASGNMVASNQQMGNLFEQSLLVALDSVCASMKDKLHLSDRDMEARHRNVE